MPQNQTQASAHSQSYRLRDPHPLRNSYESEAWDDNNGIVYALAESADQTITAGNSYFSGTVNLPIVVPSRVEFNAMCRVLWTATAAKRVNVYWYVDGARLDNVNYLMRGEVGNPTTTGSWRYTISMTGAYDFTATALGTHTVRLEVENTTGADSITMDALAFDLRRGRVGPA